MTFWQLSGAKDDKMSLVFRCFGSDFAFSAIGMWFDYG